MNSARPTHSLSIGLLSILLVHCLAMTGLSATRRMAHIQPAANMQPDSITIDDPQPAVEPGKSVTIKATVLNKNNVEIPGAKVEWTPPPIASASYVQLSTPLTSRSGNLLTITGLPSPAGTAPDVLIPLTAKSGNARLTIYIDYKSKATTPPKPGAAQSGVAVKMVDDAGNAVSEISLAPGGKKKVSAQVVDPSNTLKGSDVKWEIPNEQSKDFVDFANVVADGSKSTITVVAFSSDSTTPPSAVPIIARVGSVSNILLVNYKKSSASVGTIKLVKPKTDEPIAIAPGKSQDIEIQVLDESNNPIPKPKVEWAALGNGDKFVKLTKDADNEGKVTVTGLFGPDTINKPHDIAVVAKSGTKSFVFDVTYLATAEPSVDILWDVLSPDIVASNFGRAIKREFYGIEVTIGNNSGSDLQLTSLGFELPRLVKDANGQIHPDWVMEQWIDKDNKPFLDKNGAPVLRIAQDADGNDKYKIAGRVPVSSYAAVRGALAQRKLSYPRTLTLATITAFGQFLGGFNPFFINTLHAKNFSNGVNIISNPLAKGVELVWQDAYPGELDRLDQQTMRDDKIIANNTPFKTLVFISKDALFAHGDPGRNDLNEVRKRLGQMTLVGRLLERKGFIYRQRFGSSQVMP